MSHKEVSHLQFKTNPLVKHGQYKLCKPTRFIVQFSPEEVSFSITKLKLLFNMKQAMRFS